MQKPINKKLDEKVSQITITYKQLQKAQSYITKKTLIGSLRKHCLEGLEILDHQKVTTQSIRKRKQIEDMMKRCGEIETKLDSSYSKNPTTKHNKPGVTVPMLSSSNSPTQPNLAQLSSTITTSQLRQKSITVAKSIIFHQMTSQQMKITTQELDELAKRIQTNNQVMKQIQIMVIEQGGNIDKIEKQIDNTYNNVKQTNKQLEEAAQKQYQNRILKIRLGMSGFFAAFGLKILGLPGLILGFFSGIIITK